MSEHQPTRPDGLTQVEAARRLAHDGPNELTPPRQRTLLHIALEVAREPMFQLLLVAGVVYLLLGDTRDALALLVFVAMIVAITLVQEHRTERVLEALRDLTSPRALVLRDGHMQRIAGRDVVRGDLMVLSEGDRVSADGTLLSAADLRVDESLLTGEAIPVSKMMPAPPAAGPGDAAERLRVFAGTLVVGGQGLARVTATGAVSEIGRIGRSLGELESPHSPLHLQTRFLVRVFSVLGLIVSVVAVVLYGLMRGDWLAGALAGITLAMSMLPQEFLLILTVFMAMGAWRMSRQRVLTRRAATIEALGAATVLCTDKTGTLTRNRMSVAELAALHGGQLVSWRGDASPLPEVLHPLLECGVLASEVDSLDPMEQALHELARAQRDAAHRNDGWSLVREYGLSPQWLVMTHVWCRAEDGAQVVALKGAVESVLALCPAAPARAVSDAAQAMAERGLRVLGVARAEFVGSDWPETPADFAFEFLGLVALADPLREGVPAALRECRGAGIRVVMITGDHPATALAIAEQAGLDTRRGVVTGAALAAMDEGALRDCVAATEVFARVAPEQKLRIVQALKANHQVVAMTGDGVNDAPSLKAAHIGIAMGARGTDVAREASSLVLLDDDFGSIVKAVRLGRRIYDNLRKAMAFVFAVHVPIAGLSLLPLLFGWPLLFLPVHIAFLELLIDPVCSVVFEAEAEEPDVMSRPPRDPSAPLFSLRLIAWSLLQGTVVLLAVGAFYVAQLRAGVAEAQVRSGAFVALVACNVALVVVNRSFSGSLWSALWRPNAALWRILLATTVLLAATLLLEPLRELFRFAAISPSALGVALALAVVVALVLHALQQLQNRPAPPQAEARRGG